MYGQNDSRKVSPYGEYRGDWALIEVDGLFGFINREGKEIVPPKYSKISSYGVYMGDWAMVEVDGLLGFINREGKEIIPPKYEKIINNGKLEGMINGKIEIIKN